MDKEQTRPAATVGPANSGRRAPSIRRLRLMLALGVLVTAVAVVSLVQALRVSEGGYSLVQGPNVGFVVPHRTKPAPFRLPSIGGVRYVSLSEVEGKPLVINLWATFCTVCEKETPAIASVADQTRGRVTFVGIDSNEPASTGAAFVKAHHVGYLELADPTAVVARAYGLAYLPTTFFISPSGKLVGENLGALSVTTLDDDLTRLFGSATVSPSSGSAEVSSSSGAAAVSGSSGRLARGNPKAGEIDVMSAASPRSARGDAMWTGPEQPGREN